MLATTMCNSKDILFDFTFYAFMMFEFRCSRQVLCLAEYFSKLFTILRFSLVTSSYLTLGIIVIDLTYHTNVLWTSEYK